MASDKAAITPKKSTPASGSFDFIHLFAKDMASLARDLPKLEPRLATGGMIWVSWPKKTSKLFGDLTEDGVRKVCLPLGLVDVKVWDAREAVPTQDVGALRRSIGFFLLEHRDCPPCGGGESCISGTSGARVEGCLSSSRFCVEL